MRDRRPSWLPNRRQRLVLEAALFDRDRAQAAWRELKGLTSIDDLDGASGGMLPLVYRNLNRFGIDDPEVGKLKGTYRYNWAQNQLTLKAAEKSHAVLEQAGIETMVLKGLALSVSHYKDMGVRRMVDADVLVPRTSAATAVKAMETAFAPYEKDPLLATEVRHSTSFSDRNGHEVDLHWYALWQSSPDDALWADSLSAQVGAASTRIPCPEDQLLIACAHGAWDWVPAGSAIRWVADAMIVLRSQDGELDWDRFVREARARVLAHELAPSLRYLRTSFAAPIPEEALGELERAPSASFGRRPGMKFSRPAPLAALPMHLERYRRLEALDPTAPRRPNALSHLIGAFGARSLGEFLAKAARALVRKTRSVLARGRSAP